MLESLDSEAIAAFLKRDDLPADVRRVLEIRELVGSAAVKKLYSMENQACSDDRLRNLIIHHGARTGRPTGGGVQPLNLPRDGPSLRRCVSCGRYHTPRMTYCPWCSEPSAGDAESWEACGPYAIEDVLAVMATRSLAAVEYYLGDALHAISGCLRGLFIAAPGHDLIASDYSAIEAVVGAMLAGEQWRIEAFRRGDPIYLVGAAKITGRTLEEYLEYKERTKKHHPDRQNIGKVSELACLFGGWIGSYKAFGSTEEDATIKAQILAWRAASPATVEFWGGQFRGAPWDEGEVYVPELRCFGEIIRPAQMVNAKTFAPFGVEGAAVQAILWPGHTFEFRGLLFFMRGDALIVRLLSGRELTYNEAKLLPAQRQYSRPGEWSISYKTWNTNPKYGAFGWVSMETYGGRLTENIVQATAHCIQRYGIVNLRAAGYHTVLHVYDENIAEVPHGLGSLEEFERIMSTMPPWCADWPITAHGGFRAKRYRKG